MSHLRLVGPDEGSYTTAATTTGARPKGRIVHNLVLRYVATRRDRGEINAHTANNIRYQLLDLAELAPNDPNRLHRGHIQKLLELPGAIGTRNRRLYAARGFCRWAVLEGHMRRDPTVGFQTLKPGKRQARNLHSTDGFKLYRAASDARGRLIVLLELQEGLRCIEVARMEVGDIDRRGQLVDVRGKNGGGAVTRTIPISVETLAALDAYLDEYPAADGPLIRSYQSPNRGVTAHYISDLITRWLYAAGVKRRPRDGRSPHSCRHTCATDMIDNGADLFHVARHLGHTNTSTTEDYYLIGVSPDLRAAAGGRTYTEPREERRTA